MILILSLWCINIHAVTSERILNAEGGRTESSSPDSSMMSSFHMYRNRRNNNKREDGHVETERDSNSRGGSDDEDNGLILSRKKLRLTKDQSAFLEDSFKEHHTLNPVSQYHSILLLQTESCKIY